MQAQHLADEAVERGNLAQSREGEVAPGPVRGVDLAKDRGKELPVPSQLDRGPARGVRAGVEAGEHDPDHHAGDLLVGQRAAVAVPGTHEYIEHVRMRAALASALLGLILLLRRRRRASW